MGSHPVNLFVRFFLEVAALIFSGIWAHHQFDKSSLAYIMVILIPVSLAAIWGTFNVPGDPSRSGEAPVVVPGWLRLTIELAIFSFAYWAIASIGHGGWGISFFIVVVLHYALSYDRIIWLFAKKKKWISIKK
jgi:hypothetical protein